MLILLLEPGDEKGEVLIGEDITLRILDLYKDTNQVRIGIDAPKDMIVDRKVVREMRRKRINSVLEKHVL